MWRGPVLTIPMLFIPITRKLYLQQMDHMGITRP